MAAQDAHNCEINIRHIIKNMKMKIILVLLILVAVAGCKSKARFDAAFIEAQDASAGISRRIDNFFGLALDSRRSMKSQNGIEQYCLGWKEDALWAYILECKKERDANATITRFTDAVSVSFCFIVDRHGVYDLITEDVYFKLEEGVVKHAYWGGKNVYGLPIKDLPLANDNTIRYVNKPFPVVEP